MKRKWYIGGLIPLYYSLSRFVLTFLVYGIARIILDFDFVYIYFYSSLILGHLITLAGYIATLVIIRKLLKSSEVPENKTDDYFSKFASKMLLKSFVDVATAFIWEMGGYLSNTIDRIKGINYAGHPSGVMFIFALLFSVLQIFVSIIISFSFKRRYRKKIQG